MKFLPFTLAGFLFSAFGLLAQDGPKPADFNHCGTPPGWNLPFIRAYQQHPEKFDFRADDTLWTAVQMHLLANDMGEGRLFSEKMLDAFCQLNKDYAPSNIRFFFKNDWHLIDKTAWYQHDTLSVGVAMMFANNVPNALNAYFVNVAAGSAGYNLPYAGVAMRNAEAGLNNHTWTHEIGHALALEHTFIGWEGKQYNPNLPTPDTLTYNYAYFHDTLDTNFPVPLDTALVEYLDGSNCGISADRICDTKPDYLSYRWNCNNQNMSTVQLKDPAGAPFYADATLYMSYSYDNCQNRFSPAQIQIMRAYLMNPKANWLAAGPQANAIVDVPQLVSPESGAMAPDTGAVLQWAPTPGATHYLIQVSRIPSFGINEQELISADTFVLTNPLSVNKTYYWRVRPFNASYTCSGYSGSKSFIATETIGVTAAPADGSRCYPTLLQPGQPITLEMAEPWLHQTVECAVYDAAGRLHWKARLELNDKRQDIALPSGNWAPGLYFFECFGTGGALRQSIVLLGQ